MGVLDLAAPLVTRTPSCGEKHRLKGGGAGYLCQPPESHVEGLSLGCLFPSTAGLLHTAALRGLGGRPPAQIHTQSWLGVAQSLGLNRYLGSRSISLLIERQSIGPALELECAF